MQSPKRSDISYEELRRILEYDPITGHFRWKINAGSSVRIGDRAGRKAPGTYHQIKIAGKNYCAHRLAWLYMTGEWPKADVDHRDNDPGNDAWENLREASVTQNLANSRRCKRNKSGYKGVSWSGKKWRAVIGIGGKMKHLGYFADPEVAHAAYMSAARAIFGEFARAF